MRTDQLVLNKCLALARPFALGVTMLIKVEVFESSTLDILAHTKNLFQGVRLVLKEYFDSFFHVLSVISKFCNSRSMIENQNSWKISIERFQKLHSQLCSSVSSLNAALNLVFEQKLHANAIPPLIKTLQQVVNKLQSLRDKKSQLFNCYIEPIRMTLLNMHRCSQSASVYEQRKSILSALGALEESDHSLNSYEEQSKLLKKEISAMKEAHDDILLKIREAHKTASHGFPKCDEESLLKVLDSKIELIETVQLFGADLRVASIEFHSLVCRLSTFFDALIEPRHLEVRHEQESREHKHQEHNRLIMEEMDDFIEDKKYLFDWCRFLCSDDSGSSQELSIAIAWRQQLRDVEGKPARFSDDLHRGMTKGIGTLESLFSQDLDQDVSHNLLYL